MTWDDRLRQAWDEGRTAVGAFVFTRLDPITVEAVAALGFDYICVDLQHGMMDFSEAIAILQAISLGAATPLVRVPNHDGALIGRALDAGALGVIVPMVETADQAARAVAACRYAPAGNRSFGPVRAGIRYGPAYPAEANERVVCIPMIETAAAVAAADEICAVPGVGAVYVGPADLALTYGQAPTLDNEGPFAAALDAVVWAAKRHGVVAGVHASAALAASRQAAGFAMVTVAADLGIIVQGFAAELRRARASLAPGAPGGPGPA